jgi:ribosomal protein S18 acetylase RimI-like enzyme
MEIQQASVNVELLAACQRLHTAHVTTVEDLTALTNAGGRIFTATLDRQIVGLLILVTYQVLTGKKAIIEDVIVDATVRRQGIGAELCRAAVNTARALNCGRVTLTSHPDREAANRLYQRLGFVKNGTNIYQLKLENEIAS